MFWPFAKYDTDLYDGNILLRLHSSRSDRLKRPGKHKNEISRR